MAGERISLQAHSPNRASRAKRDAEELLSPLDRRLGQLADRYETAREQAARAKVAAWPACEAVRRLVAREFAAMLRQRGSAFAWRGIRYFCVEDGPALELVRNRITYGAGSHG